MRKIITSSGRGAGGDVMCEGGDPRCRTFGIADPSPLSLATEPIVIGKRVVKW